MTVGEGSKEFEVEEKLSTNRLIDTSQSKAARSPQVSNKVSSQASGSQFAGSSSVKNVMNTTNTEDATDRTIVVRDSGAIRRIQETPEMLMTEVKEEIASDVVLSRVFDD
jgi:hypothetical protein